MNIYLNGQSRDVPPQITVADLLQQMELEPRLVAVEVNRDVVSRTRHAQHVLQEGDRLEIVTLVGGG
jgi:thiamine biosynthesis protein ThiS